MGDVVEFRRPSSTTVTIADLIAAAKRRGIAYVEGTITGPGQILLTGRISHPAVASIAEAMAIRTQREREWQRHAHVFKPAGFSVRVKLNWVER